MNQSYKTIFSKVHQCFVVVSELAKSQGKGSRASRLKKTAVTLLAATAFGGLSGQAWAEPSISELSETVNGLSAVTKGFSGDTAIKKYIDEYKLATDGDKAATNEKLSAQSQALSKLKDNFDEYKEATGETLKLQSDAINELVALTAKFPEGETIKEYIDEADTNTTYKVEKTPGTGKTVNTYTLKASDNSETGETIVDTDTYVKESSVSSSTDSATGTTTHTVTLKDNTGTEMTSFAVTDTNTQSTVKHADSSKDYLTVTSADNSIGTKDYTVALTDKANTAIGNASTFLTSSGFSAGGGKVTVTDQGFAVQGGPSMTADGIDAGGKVISNVADGQDANDAVNYGQLQKVDQKIDSQDNALRKLAHRDAQLERKIYRAGAHAAAIAALHPLDYDEDHKFTAAAGVGQYHGSSAMAVGAFYRPTENLMFSVGASLNENDSMVNAGMAYRFGTGSGNKTSPDNIHEMKRQISTLSEENRQLSAQLNSSETKLAAESERSARLEAEINKIKKLLKLK